MKPRVIHALRVLIALMILLLLIAQAIAVPYVAASFAERYPEFAPLQVPGVIATILLILCVEATFVCVWQLLSLVSRDVIFSRAAFRWVDGILITLATATGIVAVAFVLLLIAGATTPSISLLMIFGIVIGCGLCLLLVVLRDLLEKALRLEEDLAEVV